MNLTASFSSPPPAGQILWQWSIAGPYIGDYRLIGKDSYVSPGQSPMPYATPSPITSVPTEGTNFYWIGGSSTTFPITVSASAYDGSWQSTATATYQVEAPTAVSFSAATNPVQIGQYYKGAPELQFLSLGTQLNLPTSAGTYTTLNAIAPKDYGGMFAITQTLNTSTTTYYFNKPPVIDGNGSAFLLDGCSLYTANTHVVTEPNPPSDTSAGQPVNYQTIDAPSLGLDLFTISRLQTAQTFYTFLMFSPDVSGNRIWVPLANFEWQLNGTAVNQLDGEWLLQQQSANPNPIVGSPSQSFPTWSGVDGAQTTCETPKGRSGIRAPSSPLGRGAANASRS